MCNETVQVLIVGPLNSQIPTANIINCLVIHHKTTIGVFEGGMCGEDGVVWLYDRSSDLRSRVHAELQLAFLAIIN